ncbi:20740_t:CDS:2 [Cetraspora pellucida]|uniref:20740_t:CDS:1 n=1 Tax=Cetraspora pellucida TaxID=1433469 RepID=A0A9N9CEG3_9GLOM|nr:20740_t:CDS:2 [Cetraspora pellucida]
MSIVNANNQSYSFKDSEPSKASNSINVKNYFDKLQKIIQKVFLLSNKFRI